MLIGNIRLSRGNAVSLPLNAVNTELMQHPAHFWIGPAIQRMISIAGRIHNTPVRVK
ncbi:hypothetical protein PDO_2839 [Rhizobium sp. PDO1-076]|nr:hypothetical protein PDO_2839 [Rhizobium sp. PDO1-076]